LIKHKNNPRTNRKDGYKDDAMQFVQNNIFALLLQFFKYPTHISSPTLISHGILRRGELKFNPNIKHMVANL